MGIRVEQTADRTRKIEERMTEMSSQMGDFAETFHNRLNVIDTKFEALCDQVTQLVSLMKAPSHKKWEVIHHLVSFFLKRFWNAQ